MPELDLSTVIIIGVILLLAEALFSGAEIAIVSADRARLRAKAEEGNRGASLALELLEKPEWLMGTILTCHNASFVTNVSLATITAINFVGPAYGEALSIALVIPLLVVFGEVVPKGYCQARADVLAPLLARVVWGARLIVYPLVWLISMLIGTVVGLGKRNGESTPFVTRQELESLMEEQSDGDVQVLERQMIGRIFTFGDLDMENVLVPIVDLSAVDEESTVEEVISTIENDGHSRILIYRENLHHIVGVVHAKDILGLGADAAGRLKDKDGLIRRVYIVPETKPADSLLDELMSRKDKMAVVVDEYGACTGIVTMEDLVEEIVGDIADEYDVDEVRLFHNLGEDQFLVDARMEVEDVREQLKLPVPDGDYETLSGYLLERFERIPKEGEHISLEDWTLTVQSANERQIGTVRVEKNV
ncbi:MAG: hemolysin family protein [Nitrospinae bacterium]|nr:hemolysin family protein [Nitrospinota bacterium]